MYRYLFVEEFKKQTLEFNNNGCNLSTNYIDRNTAHNSLHLLPLLSLQNQIQLKPNQSYINQAV